MVGWSVSPYLEKLTNGEIGKWETILLFSYFSIILGFLSTVDYVVISLLKVCPRQYDPVNISDGKYLLTGTADEFILWDVVAGVKIKSSIATKQGLTSAVFSPDGKVIATTSTDNTVKLWKPLGK